MNEQKISFKTAKLLKEKGIVIENIDNLYFFDTTGEFLMNRELAVNVGLNNCYPDYSQTILQKILREKYNIHVWLVPNNSPDVCDGYVCFTQGKYVADDSYEASLEEGLYNALQLIK